MSSFNGASNIKPSVSSVPSSLSSLHFEGQLSGNPLTKPRLACCWGFHEGCLLRYHTGFGVIESPIVCEELRSSSRSRPAEIPARRPGVCRLGGGMACFAGCACLLVRGVVWCRSDTNSVQNYFNRVRSVHQHAWVGCQFIQFSSGTGVKSSVQFVQFSSGTFSALVLGDEDYHL